MTKLNNFLLKILLASILIFGLSLIFSRNEKSAPKALESALLNPKYKGEVNMITIQAQEKSVSTNKKGNSQITLKKQGDFWLFSKFTEESNEEICAIADSKIIDSLIEKAASLRSLYKITDKERDYLSLGVSENAESTLAFSKNNDKMYTKVHFGLSNSLKNRIYFRSEGKKTVYESQNDFEQYLNTDINYWSEGKIIPEIKNPVQISFKTNEGSVGQPPKTITMDEKSSGFASKSKALLSLRHGKIWPETTINSENYISNLSVQDGSGRIAKLDFFKIQNGDDESYFYRKSLQPSPVDSQENIFAFYSEKAAYEISAWTYEKIIQTVLTAE